MPSQGRRRSTVEVLNLWCAEGMRAVKLAEVQRLRFVNPVIENEFRRALETLALSHDSQKKAVSLHFAGEGKRKVEVGYVIENPIWKTSYRLVLDKKEQAVPARLGGGREPDRRGLEQRDDGAGQRPADLVPDGPVQPAVRQPADGRAGTVRLAAAADLQRRDDEDASDRWPATGRTDRAASERELARHAPMRLTPRPRTAASGDRADAGEDAEADGSYAGEARREARSEAWTSARSVQSVATASALGDFFQYVIDHPVDLARQKSALLPIVNKDVEGKRVSIYNQAVQAKHPLLASSSRTPPACT